MGNTVTKAKLEIEGGDSFYVQFNPAEYSLDSSIQYSEKNVPGLDGPIGQYIAGNSTTLNMSLYFDTYSPPTLTQPTEGGTDVTEYTKKISKLMLIDGQLHRVPQVTFSWGSLQFSGIILNVKETYTMFLSDGMPVRARVDLTFKSVFDLTTGKRSYPLESPDRTKIRTVLQGESLWSIAAEEYGQPEHWRIIAKENGILNPLQVAPGRMLRLPPL